MVRRVLMGALSFIVLAASGLTGCSSESTSSGSDAGNGDSGPSAGGSGGASDGGHEPSSGGTKATDAGSKTTDAGSSTMHRDRSSLKNVGTTAPLDYSNPALWLCLPGTDPDECLDDIDATVIAKDGTTSVQKIETAASPDFDCFYVYPTVDLTGKGNVTDFSDISLILDPLLAQAAPFRQLCKVYAPLYRQQSIATGGSGDGGSGTLTGDPAVADGDVQNAFQYYLDHYNAGRRFVLMGHSQGTMKLINLIAKTIDTDATLRGKLISAVLPGAPSDLLYAPTGKDVGGSFKNVKLCTTKGQAGCVVGYNSFAKEAPPPANSVFGQAPTGNVNACTDPLTLVGNTGFFTGSYFPVKLAQTLFTPDTPMATPPAVSTPFRVYPDMFKGQCVNKGGYNYYEISAAPASDDKRAIPPYRSTLLEGVGFGLHVEDYAFPLEDLIALVKMQAAATP